MLRGVLLVSLLALSACTTYVVRPEGVPVSTVSQCSAPVGVSVEYNNLFIALGKTRELGTRLVLTSQLRHEQSYQFTYQVVRYAAPVNAQGAIAPCLVIVMPDVWQEAFVVNEQSGEQWRVTP